MNLSFSKLSWLLMERFRQSGLIISAVLLLAFTVYCFWGARPENFSEVLRAWHGKGHIALLAFATGVVGIWIDMFAWNCAWRSQGVRLPLRTAIPLYYSGLALQLLPLQLCRITRIALAFRSGTATLRQALTAESLSLGLDVLALLNVLLAFVLPWPYKWVAFGTGLVTGPVAVLVADRFRGLIARRFKHLTDYSFATPYSLATYYGRILDWISVSLVLYLVASVTIPDVRFETCGATALGASILGAASALPGGLGVNEAILAVGIGQGQNAELLLERSTTVFVYRLLTFWMWIPVGWWGLITFRKRAIATRRTAAPRGAPDA